MGSKIGDQVGSGGANRRPDGAQWMYGTERDNGPGVGPGHGGNLLAVDGGGGSYASKSESGNVSPVEGPREGGGVLRNWEFVKRIGKFEAGPLGKGR